MAQRSANQLVIESMLAQLGEAAYHNGDWDAALAASTPRLSDPAQDVMASACWTHDQIALARHERALRMPSESSSLDPEPTMPSTF